MAVSAPTKPFAPVTRTREPGSKTAFEGGLRFESLETVVEVLKFVLRDREVKNEAVVGVVSRKPDLIVIHTLSDGTLLSAVNAITI